MPGHYLAIDRCGEHEVARYSLTHGQLRASGGNSCPGGSDPIRSRSSLEELKGLARGVAAGTCHSRCVCGSIERGLADSTSRKQSREANGIRGRTIGFTCCTSKLSACALELLGSCAANQVSKFGLGCGQASTPLLDVLRKSGL